MVVCVDNIIFAKYNLLRAFDAITSLNLDEIKRKKGMCFCGFTCENI